MTLLGIFMRKHTILLAFVHLLTIIVTTNHKLLNIYYQTFYLLCHGVAKLLESKV